ncbi:MAG: hypothetical protein J2P19_15495, partial [Pseudonocardia sp.]|nr:hypothetical protein [Pseudonocardia sp.]
RAMVRFVTRVAAPPLAVALLVALAGCNSGAGASGSSGAEPPPPTPPSAAPTSVSVVIPPSLPSPAPRPPAPGLRAMTPAEKQYKDNCERRIVRSGCQFYSDQSLRLQGVDPEATVPGYIPTTP